MIKTALGEYIHTIILLATYHRGPENDTLCGGTVKESHGMQFK